MVIAIDYLLQKINGIRMCLGIIHPLEKHERFNGVTNERLRVVGDVSLHRTCICVSNAFDEYRATRCLRHEGS